MEGATIDAGPKRLFEDAELWVEAGEHVCLIGHNGSGKSTLISTLVGEREPVSGRVKVGHNVELGHLRQHAEVPAEPGLTVLSHAQRSTGLSEAKTRGLLGQFLFSGDDVQKLVSQLSGGEAQRLSLAILVSSNSNVLILDEPTNHLDLESREALEDALARFAGTLLLVSHDRAMLEAVGTRTVAVEDRKLRVFLGGWAEYREREAEEAEAERTAGSGPSRSAHICQRTVRGLTPRGGRRRGRPARRRAPPSRTSASSRTRSRRPSRRCASSRRSSPTPPHGPTRAPRRNRPAATTRRKRRSES